MTLTDMRRILGERGIQLTRSLGQNFLHDGNQLRRIAALGEPGPGDRLLEIGPGLGPLTELLLASGAHVLAIEKDARLVEILRERFAQEPRFELRHEDALETVTRERHWAGWKLIANLPYSVASPILVELALAPEPPERLVATLQLEVAKRLMAKAGEDDYGVLSLLVQLAYQPAQLLRVPASCFFPAPEVESGCLRLDRRPAPLLPPELQPAYVKVVKRAFSQRRKMMLKLLRANWPPDRLAAAWSSLGLDPGVRAEAVPLEQFVRLTRALAATSAG